MDPNDERRPPEKIRVTKLQEAQVADLVAVEQHCVGMLYAIGATEEQLKPRGDVQIASLPRKHDVLVAEADDTVAGYLAWADQAPGVAWVSILNVHPDFQRLGVGTCLLRELGESAGAHGIKHVVTSCYNNAAWAISFLGVRGFVPLEGKLPEPLAQWAEENAADLTGPSQGLWYRATDGLGTIPGLPRP